MSEQYLIEIEKENKLIHQGNIFDQCTIGADKNNYYQSSGLKNNELLIREIGGVFNIVANSGNWKLNGKKLEERKYYILGKKNKLRFSKYNIEIKKIKDASTGGLELASEKVDVNDLMERNRSTSGNQPVVDIYNQKDEDSTEKKDNHLGHLKKIGAIASFASTMLNLTLLYLSTWIVTPLLQKSDFALYLEEIEKFVLTSLHKINPSYVNNNQLHFFQVLFKEGQKIDKLAFLFDQLMIQLILGAMIYLTIKVIGSLIIGRPLTFSLLGIKIEGNSITARIRSALYEILGPLFIPFSFYNLYGLLPIKSIPEIVLRINYLKTSRLLPLIGPPILILISAGLITSPLIYLQMSDSVTISSSPLPKRRRKQPQINTQTINFSSTTVDIPLDDEMSIENKSTNKINRYKISGGKLKKNILLTEMADPILSWKTSVASGNPLAFLIYPIHALKNINFPIPQGNAEAFQSERLNMMTTITQNSPDRIIENILEIGPFISGLFFSRKEFINSISTVIASRDLPIQSYWIKNNGNALVLIASDNILIGYPMDSSKKMIQISSSSKSDLSKFMTFFLRNQSSVMLPLTKPSIMDEMFNLIGEIEIENIQSKINTLLDGETLKNIKNMQNTQKELTNQVNKATKATKEAIEEIDSE